MKFWDSRRIGREREKRRRREAAEKTRYFQNVERERSYTIGDHRKNAMLMFDALGSPDRRRMVVRLKDRGAMSLSKLAAPFHLKLPTAHAHVKMLERSGIVKTHKRGRVRICVYNPAALRELAGFLKSFA